MDIPCIFLLPHLWATVSIGNVHHIIDMVIKNTGNHEFNFVLSYQTSNVCNHGNWCSSGNSTRDNCVCLMGDYLVSIYFAGLGIGDCFPDLLGKQTFQREMDSFRDWDKMDFYDFNFSNSCLITVYHSYKFESAFWY